MTVFITLLGKILPLYALILFGFLAGRKLGAKKETVASLLLYIIVPMVIFHGVLTTPITLSSISLPFVIFFISAFLCLLFFAIGKQVFSDSTKNILAFTAGTGNTGYFGLPVALAILDSQSVGLYIMCLLGIIFYQYSLGFFITARGHHTIEESIGKVLKLPTVYVFLLALVINLLGFQTNSGVNEFFNNFRGSYTVLGMMIIGLGLASISKYEFDPPFTALAFIAKFIAWPLTVVTIIYLDSIFFHLFTPQIQKVLLLFSIVPLAADTVTVATELKAHPEKSALAVLLSTILALFYVPLMVSLFVKS